ncbi:AAA family ATPase [Gynuella sunshinyii]|uniref:Putative kinase n=1 Tax=Gynuella sunshinyii YC6258 TaxID=1445510 RepID=A0A0C5VK07_9GAMM|nr:AAA family ATPase [Gynuella sunshinyii]AJQ95012.1 putative kinase [Gynuella sunshinyii YC6258]
MKRPILYIFSGLPGSGKSTLAQRLAAETGAVYLRIDTIEQGVRDLCHYNVEGEGYRLAYRIAADNLQLRLNVIADSCNPIELTRQEWHEVAIESDTECVDIEVVCSDPVEHRTRVEQRISDVKGLVLPSWTQVTAREYHPWKSGVITIDTAHKSIDDSYNELWQTLTDWCSQHTGSVS